MYDGHQLNDIMNSTTSKIFNDDEEQTSHITLFEGETLRFHMEAPPFYLSLPILLSIEVPLITSIVYHTVWPMH